MARAYLSMMLRRMLRKADIGKQKISFQCIYVIFMAKCIGTLCFSVKFMTVIEASNGNTK